jgi:hypothetical protein
MLNTYIIMKCVRFVYSFSHHTPAHSCFQTKDVKLSWIIHIMHATKSHSMHVVWNHWSMQAMEFHTVLEHTFGHYSIIMENHPVLALRLVVVTDSMIYVDFPNQRKYLESCQSILTSERKVFLIHIILQYHVQSLLVSFPMAVGVTNDCK